MTEHASDNDVTPFAVTTHRNKEQRFGIKRDDRRRHTYVIGKTGMGKSNLLEIMAISDIRNGNGLAVVDPHGEFAQKVLDFIPEERIDDVVYFNPADLEFPMALNVVERVGEDQRHLITDGLVGIFEKQWAHSWGPRLEYILRNAILTLLEVPGATLLGVMRLLVDDTYREKAIRKITDPVVRQFWVDEFNKYAGQFASEAVAPIQNKVGQFVANPMIRNIIGQEQTAFDFRKIMDEGKILIMNLSKGKVGEGGSQLLGAMMITKLQLAAMSRVNMPEHERRDFCLYVDEFQNFATQSFAEILSEARKYRLNLILAHQYIAQMSEEVRDAVFGNVGTIISFRVGGADADEMEEEFSPRYAVNDLVNVPKYHILLKLMIDGVASPPFSARVLPPFEQPVRSFRDEIIERSREQYATPRAIVDEDIREWVGDDSDVRDLFETICSRCGAETLVPFEPDEKRPVYCKKCMAEVQQKKQEAAERRSEKSERNETKKSNAKKSSTKKEEPQKSAPATKRTKSDETADKTPQSQSSRTSPKPRGNDSDSKSAPLKDRDAMPTASEVAVSAPSVPKSTDESQSGRSDDKDGDDAEPKRGRPSLNNAIERDRKERNNKRKKPDVQGLRSALKKALENDEANDKEALTE